MKDYVLLMDVAGDVDRSYVEQGKVTLLPMEFNINGEVYTYTDDERGMSPEQFYEFVKQKATMSTFQLTPENSREYFEPYAKAGKSILCTWISSGLTNSSEGAMQVAQELMQKYPGVEIYVVDSLRATGIEGLITERMIENKQKGMSIKENYDDLMQFRNKTRACAYVDDLTALQRGGRISKTVAIVGGLLGIKPLIQFMPDGTLDVWGKQRGYKQSINKMIEYYLDKADVENKQTVYITHANDIDYANELADKVKAVSPHAEIKIRLLSPIIGVHLGPSAMVLAFIAK